MITGFKGLVWVLPVTEEKITIMIITIIELQINIIQNVDPKKEKKKLIIDM